MQVGINSKSGEVSNVCLAHTDGSDFEHLDYNKRVGCGWWPNKINA